MANHILLETNGQRRIIEGPKISLTYALNRARQMAAVSPNKADRFVVTTGAFKGICVFGPLKKGKLKLDVLAGDLAFPPTGKHTAPQSDFPTKEAVSKALKELEKSRKTKEKRS